MKLNIIDDCIISEADGDDLIGSIDRLRACLPELSRSQLKDLLRREVSLRLVYVTIRGVNHHWYNRYSTDEAYVESLKKQLKYLRVR